MITAVWAVLELLDVALICVCASFLALLMIRYDISKAHDLLREIRDLLAQKGD
jgi:hypothetical protein